MNDDPLLQEDIPQCISDPSYKRKTKEHKKTNQEPPKKSTIDTPKPESSPPTEEIQKYRELLEILKPYHNPKKDILITNADIVL